MSDPRISTPKRLDAVDSTLVRALRANARTPAAELGRLVGLSGPAVYARLQRLERDGVVTGYHAAVAGTAVGLSVSALVSIYQRDDVEQDDLATAMSAVPAISACWSVAGDEAFVLMVRVADVDALERTLATLRRIPGVARTRTTVVLSTRWEDRIPLPEAVDQVEPPAGPEG